MVGFKALSGVRVIEFDAIGPAPFCGMMLADHGASVLRVSRPGEPPAGIDSGRYDLTRRSRPALPLNLKSAKDQELALKLVQHADVLIEGYRPMVMERLGLGPDVCLQHNARLVYARVTGFGQSGPLAHAPGHDINYIAISGVLHACGEPDGAPRPPLNLVADFAGGGMMLAFGILAGLLAARSTGHGSVVDAAMCDGAALLMAFTRGMHNAGLWSCVRGDNLLDGGAPFYGTYETRDRRYVAIGALEPKFYAALRSALCLTDPLFDQQMDRSRWPAMREAIATAIRARTRDEWVALCEGTDACLSPVLDLDEAPGHPQNEARDSFYAVPGGHAPRPAPRIASLNPAPEVSTQPGLQALLKSWVLPTDIEQRMLRSASTSVNSMTPDSP